MLGAAAMSGTALPVAGRAEETQTSLPRLKVAPDLVLRQAAGLRPFVLLGAARWTEDHIRPGPCRTHGRDGTCLGRHDAAGRPTVHSAKGGRPSGRVQLYRLRADAKRGRVRLHQQVRLHGGNRYWELRHSWRISPLVVLIPVRAMA